jgi:hypothetical protein
MGFNSTHRLPYLTTHAGAKKWHDQIKPLRGSEPELRPLAARRDKHMQIRENAQGDIECLLYETPVVIFKQDESVVITPGKWVSSYTSAFIEGLLPDICVNRTRGMLVLHLNRSGEKFPLKKDMTLTMRRVTRAGGLAHVMKWEVQQAEGIGAWAPNRTKANSVRSKYKEMLNYHKGTVLMLTQQREKNNEDDPFEAGKIVVLQKQMLADSLGVRSDTERVWSGGQSPVEATNTYVDTQMFRKVMHKPTWVGYAHGGNNEDERRAKWMEFRDDVLALMRSDQPEDTKYANFTKASMGLLAMAGGADRVELRISGPTHGVYAHRLDRGSLEVSYSAALSAVNDFLMLAYAEEIMEFKKMPVGRVPTTNYAEMLFQDFRNEGEGK